jgi:hypothetical protein
MKRLCAQQKKRGSPGLTSHGLSLPYADIAMMTAPRPREYLKSRKNLPLNTFFTPLTSACIFSTSDKACQKKEAGLAVLKIVILRLLFTETKHSEGLIGTV